MKKYKMVQMDKNLGVPQEVKEIENQFSSWLMNSGLTEKDLLDFRTVADFNIIEKETEPNYLNFAIGYGKNSFTQIGLDFIIEENNTESFMALALLLFYISNKLDNANLKAPAFEQRKNYFTDRTKAFVKGNDKFKLLNL